MKRIALRPLLSIMIIAFGMLGLLILAAQQLAPLKSEGRPETIVALPNSGPLPQGTAVVNSLKFDPKHSWYKHVTEPTFRYEREMVEVIARNITFPHVIKQGEYLLSGEFPIAEILCLGTAYYAGNVQGLIWAMDRDTVEEHNLHWAIDAAQDLVEPCHMGFLQRVFADQNAKDRNELEEVKEEIAGRIEVIQNVLRYAQTVKIKAAKGPKVAALLRRDGRPKQPEMVKIPAGEFQIVNIWGHGEKDQKAVRTVHIRKSFAIGRYEVTFEEYDEFVRATGRQLPNDMGWGRGRRPVIYVSWEDARAYATWLSEQTGKLYRLPTEAEWEYAARSGGRRERWAGTSEEMKLREYAWYDKNSGIRTHPVGEKKPNGLGIYDMSGNVWEWTSSLHQPYPLHVDDGRENSETKGQRVVRGGSWDDVSWDIRSSLGGWLDPEFRGDLVGFRLVQDIE